MINNYDSVVSFNLTGTTCSQKQREKSYMVKKRTWISLITMLMMLFSFSFVQGQSSANYVFSTNTSGSLASDANGNAVDMSTGTTQLIAPGNDTAASASLSSIGFNFYGMGTFFNNFSVNADGAMALGNTIVGTSGTTNGGSATTMFIAPFGGDQVTNAASNGKVHYKVVGTAPNRTLVVEWLNMELNYSSSTGDGTYQVRLYETTGVVEFVYGSMNIVSTFFTSPIIGFSNGSTAGNIASINSSTNTVVTNGTSFSGNSYPVGPITNLNSTADGSRRIYRFTPPVPAAGPTGLTISGATATAMTLNWTAASPTTNIVRYVVLNSTNGGTTYNFVANVALGTNTYNATGLVPGTTYDWKVVAISEGVESTPAIATQSTSAAATYYWVGASSSGTPGAFATLTNWNTAADGSGTTPTILNTTDVFIVDGNGSLTTGGNVYISFAAATTVGQLKIKDNTACYLQSSATTQRIITIYGGGGDDFVIESGSSLFLTNTTNSVSLIFASAVTGNTGNISGTLTVAGINATATNAGANSFLTTGGNGTIVSVTSTGVINNIATTNITTNGNVTGSASTLLFLDGSQYNVSGATTGAPWVPLATWSPSSTLTVSGLTTSTTAPANNNQSFGNIVYNCPLSTATLNFFGANTQTVKGNLTILAAGATGGTGIFRVTSTGTITVNGDIIITQGRFQSATSGTVIANGSTTVGTNGILDTASTTGTFSQRGPLLTNNGILTGTSGTLQFLNFTGSFAQTLAGSGTVLTNLATLSMQNTAGLTITHTNPIIIARANLFQGTITGSNKITFGTGLAVNCTTQIGSAGLTTPGGNFDATPTFNLGTGTYALIYAQESVSRTVGFEVPPTRLVNTINLTNSNGLILSGGNLGTGTLTFGTGSGNITTNSTNVLTITGTTAASIVRTSTTAYVDGPLARTLPPNLVTGSTYVFPIGKSTINPFELVNPTTGPSGNVVIQSEVFDSATGGTSGSLFGSLNSNRYWAASFISGGSNFADALVRLNDNPNGADAIGASETLTGVYDLIGGLTSTVTASSITTTSPEDISALNYYVMASKATPTLSNLTITPQGNRCPAVARTVTVDVAIGAGAISGVVINYSVNGTPQTAINMTNTSGTTWSGTIPVPTPSNATIAWSVTATDVNALTKTQAGVTYSDEGIGTDVITITPSVPNFCGTGGPVTLTANSTIPGVVYTWESLTSGVILSTSTGSSTTATISTTTDFKVTGTPNDGGCPSVAYISVGVYDLPSATVTTTASGVCPGTSATINSGLSAGNFVSASITHAPRVAPSNAVTLATAGAAVVPQTSGTLDDGGWGGIPVGFNFNFFGTNYNTINVGTNGTVMFGTYNGTSLADFAYTTLPSASEPFNLVAVLAMDNNLANSGGSDGSTSGTQGGTLKYWTEGYAPNRKFIVSYENVREYGDTRVSTAQAVFFETTGIIEVHVTSSTNIDRNKLVGVNNGNGTIGVLAYASGTTASSTNPITNPFAYRFTPPANYTTTWTATDANGTTTIATGTNIFSQTVAPLITTTYSISYTNQTTGCTNASGSAQVVMSVLNSNAPAGVNTIASASSICLGQSVNLSMDYTGSNDGLTFQWQSSIDNGTSWQNIASATTTTTIVSPTIPTRYRCQIISCGGTPAYSSVAQVDFTNQITSTTPATRCGTGTVTIEATSNAGTTVNWYADNTGGVSIGTGSPFTTPSISSSTTYYASAETITNASVTLGSTATIDTAFGTTSSPDGGMVLTTTTNNVIINSIDVLVAGTGNLTIKLQNSAGVDIASTTINGFTGSATSLTNVVLPSTFVIPTAGTGYRLLCTSLGSGLSWYYQTGAFPFSTPGVTITSGWGWGATTTDLRFIHKINMTVPTVCASPRVAVPVTVNPAPALTLSSSNATICSGVATTIPVTITSNVADFDTYTWSPSIGVTGNSSTGWIFNPTSSTTYTLTASQSSGSLCSNTATFVVSANQLPSAMTITPAAPEVCVDSVQALTVTGGAISNIANFGSSTTTNTATGYPSPFTNYYGGTKHQMLIRASELTALGLTPNSTINSISFDVASVGTSFSGTLQNFQVDMGSTTDDVLTSTTFLPTTTNVRAAGNLAVTIGLVNIPLNGSFTWDGTSNIVIQTSYSNNNSGTTNYSVQMRNSDPGFVSTNWYRVDSASSDSVLTATTPTSSGNARPNIVLNYSSPTNITWSPVTNLYTDAAASTPYTAGTNASTVYVKSSSAGTASYTATATASLTGCTNSANVNVIVNPLPTVVTVNPTAVCSPATVDLTAAAVTTGSDSGLTYTYWTNPEATNALASPSTVATSGTYYIKGTNSNGCSSIITPVTVTINPLPTLITVDPATVCYPATVDLTTAAVTTGSDSGLTFTYFTDLAATNALTNPNAVTTSGTYYIKGTNANGCSSIASVIVTINVTSAPTGDATQTFCGASNITQLIAVGSGIKWYDAATGGNLLPNITAIGLTNGTTYYASQTVNGCESTDRFAVTVVVNTIPTAPNASAQSFCNSATVADLLPSGSSYNWYSAATGGSALASSDVLSSNTYYVSQTLNGCESARTAVTVTINTTAAPTAADQSFCNSALVANLTATGTNLSWYLASTGGSALSPSTSLTSTTYYVSQTLNGCESSRTAVLVTVNTTSAPTASAQTFCTSATVADLTASGSNLSWYSNSTGGTALTSGTTLSTGIYYVSQNVDGCESPRTAVNVTISTPSTPTGNAVQTIYGGVASDATIEDINVNGSNIVWYPTPGDAAAGTNAIPAGTQLVDGAVYYAVSVVGTCRSAALAVTVTVVLDSASFDIKSLKYYPNPVVDRFTVSYTKSITAIQVYDINGRLVKNLQTNGNEVNVDMSDVAASVYIVKVFADDTMGEFKVVKTE